MEQGISDIDYEICEKLLARIVAGRYTQAVYLFLDPIESVVSAFPDYAQVIERPYVRALLSGYSAHKTSLPDFYLVIVRL